MVKHVILWTLKDEFSEDEKANVKAGIKEGLESRKGKIPAFEVSPGHKVRCLKFDSYPEVK